MAVLTRRNFLSTVGLALGGHFVGPANHAWPILLSSKMDPGPKNSILFEQILPSASGITWKHVSGRSSEHYLPETAGPGCAFLDYDNDGWMDIYLVNSGRCDFF